MSTRLDFMLQKHPEHEEGIRLLASRDPSGNLKYLPWSAKVLASGQAMAAEIADVVDLFHRFSQSGARRMLHRVGGQRRRADLLRPDLHSYGPSDLARLRDQLRSLKRAQDQKRRKRDKLYRLDSEMEADVVYDSDDLIVRHIKNKPASVHYGRSTKWCISMLREGYFEDYETANATFFFFERKTPKGDEYDKIALMLPRSLNHQAITEAFTSLDRRVDMMVLATVHGDRVFEIFRVIHDKSESYPGSILFHVYQGTANAEQCDAALSLVVKGKLSPYEREGLIEAIACNDGASPELLATLAKSASALVMPSAKDKRRSRKRRSRYGVKDLERTLDAALAIHPQTPSDLREVILARLKRRRIAVSTIHRSNRVGRIEVSFGSPKKRMRHFRRHGTTVKQILKRAEMFERMAQRNRKRAETLARKLDAKKKRAS